MRLPPVPPQELREGAEEVLRPRLALAHDDGREDEHAVERGGRTLSAVRPAAASEASTASPAPRQRTFTCPEPTACAAT